MTTLIDIDNTFRSYQAIISFYTTYKNETFSNIHLEIKTFFSANMSAALGAVLDLLISDFNSIHFDHISPGIETILSKNEFLTYYGRNKLEDYFGTTIKFQKIKPTDGRYFKNYVVSELFHNRSSDLPVMSAEVRHKIIEAIYEIFVNAQIHSETSSIYTCGQFFPNKNKIEFTIVDIGIGFRNKINRRFNAKLTAVQAIRWAIKDKKTTKEGITGGIGLPILREFIYENDGKMQIISNEGFYQYSKKGEFYQVFRGSFPGTIVNLQIRTDDQKNYFLRNEVDIDDIF